MNVFPLIFKTRNNKWMSIFIITTQHYTRQSNQEKKVPSLEIKTKISLFADNIIFSVENLSELLKPLLDTELNNERRFYSGTSLFRNSGKET